MELEKIRWFTPSSQMQIFCDYEWMYVREKREGRGGRKKDYGLRISEISRDWCSLEGETHDRKSSRSSFVSTQMEIYVYCASMLYIYFAYLLLFIEKKN